MTLLTAIEASRFQSAVSGGVPDLSGKLGNIGNSELK
jgi:hypothetical protein